MYQHAPAMFRRVDFGLSGVTTSHFLCDHTTGTYQHYDMLAMYQ